MHILKSLRRLGLVALSFCCSCDGVDGLISSARDNTQANASTGDASGAAVPAAGPVDASNLTSLSLAAGDGNFYSPERGFMKYIDLRSQTDFSSVKNAGYSIGWGVFRLDDYNNTAQLPAAYLTELNQKFSLARQAHIKLLIRFAYNYPYDSYNGSNSSDAALSIVVGHIAQLGPVLEANKDVIVAIEAGFVGQWGEWHDSTHGLAVDPNRLPILNALAQYFPADRQIMLRTPEIKQTLVGGPVTQATRFSGALAARFAWHNDCFLDGEDDAGTYRNAAEKTFMAQDSVYQGMVGETCNVAQPRTDCPTAVSELAMFHWSLLNRDWYPGVYNNWQTQGCFADIAANLGYRLRLANLKVASSVKVGQPVGLTAQLTNVGYARVLNRRPIYIVLSGGGVTKTVSLSAVDLRDAAPGSALALSGSVPTDGLPQGTYSLGLRLPDNDSALALVPDYSIRLDHANTWDPSTGVNVLAQITIQ